MVVTYWSSRALKQGKADWGRKLGYCYRHRLSKTGQLRLLREDSEPWWFTVVVVRRVKRYVVRQDVIIAAGMGLN